MNALILLQQAERFGSPVIGIVVPAVILLISCVVTWALYKHFAK